MHSAPLHHSSPPALPWRLSSKPSVWLCSVLFVLLAWCSVPTTGHAQQSAYTFVLRGVPLDQALETFSQTTGVAVAYAPHIAEDHRAYCVARDEPAEAVLQCILQESGLDFYRLSSGTYVLTAPAEVTPARGYLTGFVADRSTGAPISDAHVQLADAGSGTVTDPSGRFTFPPLLPGEYVVRISHVGYRTWRDTLRVTPSGRTRAEAALQPEPVAVKPVVIDGIQPRRAEAQLGRSGLDADTSPVGWAAGSRRPLQELNTLPGVRVHDLTADVQVQGGRPGDHQMRLDGVPVHLPRTLVGLIGPFSSFAIDRITVEKAGFGAADGSQMAGIIHAQHALGDETQADFQVDPLSLNGRLQFMPSVPGTDGVSVMTAGRVGLGALYEPTRLRTTLAAWNGLDPFLLSEPAAAPNAQIVSEAVRTATATSSPAPRYTDLHAAARVRLSPLRTLHASMYRGTRQLAGSGWSNPASPTAEYAQTSLVTTEDDYRWGNLLGRVRYDAVLGSHTLLRAQLQGSRYRLDHDYTVLDSLHVRTDDGPPRLVGRTRTPLHDGNGIQTASLEGSIDHAQGPHHILVGTELTWTESTFSLHGVRLASRSALNNVSEDGVPQFGSAAADAPRIRHGASDARIAAFAQDRITLGARWQTELGVRFTYQPDRATVYAEPRVALRYDSPRGGFGAWSMRTAAGLYRQYTYQTDASVLNASALLPSVRVWLPLDPSVTPPRAVHLAHEMVFQPTDRWRLRAEGFYKHQPHHLALRYASPGENAQTGRLAAQDQFLTHTEGHALGGSISATWEGPQIRGRALYEYNRTVRRSPALFDGRAHPAPSTVPHRAEVGVDWTPTPRWTLSLRGRAAWQRSWGFRRAYYDYFGHDADTRVQDPFDLGRPGRHRLPPLYQLDASLAYAREVGPVTLQARLEMLNVTDRTNVADWRLTRTNGRWMKAPRPLYPRLPSLVLRVRL